jgi:hypothetical protein
MSGLVFLAEGGGFSTRAALLTAGGGVVALLLILELIRQHRLQERYAAVWIASSLALIVIGVVGGLTGSFAPVGRLLGIKDERFALVVIALAFIFALLVQLTMVVSRLAEQNVRLAQEIAVLRAERESGGAVVEPVAPRAGEHVAGEPRLEDVHRHRAVPRAEPPVAGSASQRR